MNYLTSNHTQPNAYVIRNGFRIPIAPLIARNDTSALAECDVYLHVTELGEAPLGYTSWELRDGVYYRDRIGTLEEIEQALAQLQPTIEELRQNMSCTTVQGLLALDQAGLSEAYTTWSEDPSRTFAEKVFINRADVWKRTDPVLLAAAAEFQLTEEQVDGLFELAKTL